MADLKTLITKQFCIKQRLMSLEKYTNSVKDGTVLPNFTDIHLCCDNTILRYNDLKNIQNLSKQKFNDDVFRQYKERNIVDINTTQ